MAGILSFISSIAGAGIGALLQRIQNKRLTGKEREQNQFNAQQAAIQRAFASNERIASQDFNAAEAEKNRQFQANQAATQWQRGVSDMQAAGLNPALAYGQGGASAMQGASASSSPASGSAASGSASLMGLSDVIEFAKLQKDLELADMEIKNRAKDIDVKDAQIDSSRAGASLTRTNEELARKQVLAFDPLNELTLKNLEQDLKNKDVRARLDEQGISESKAREAVAINNAILSAMDAETRQELNNLNVRLRVAEIGEAEGRIKRISAEITDLYASAALKAVTSEQIDQNIKNMMIEERILHLDERTKEFQVSHQNADRNWRIAGQVVSSVTGVAATAAGVATGAGMMKNAAANTSINAARLQWQQDMAGWRPTGVIGFQ